MPVFHGQKFETRDIAQAHALENMASDNNIKLLVIVHKKYNISLPTKYFKFVPLIHSFIHPNSYIGLYLKFSLDKMMCHKLKEPNEKI